MYLWPRADIYLVKSQQVIPGPFPPKKLNGARHALTLLKYTNNLGIYFILEVVNFFVPSRVIPEK